MLKSSHLIKRLSRYAVAAFAMSASFQAFSYDFAADGLYYTISDMDKREVMVDKDEANPYSGDIVIPKTVSFRNREFTVVGIEDNVFTGNTDITSLSIKTSLSAIPKEAFARCPSLKNVMFNDDLQKIGESAFSECVALISIKIPENAVVGYSAFYKCTGLISVHTPMNIKGDAFYNCTNLSALHLYKVGGSIGEGAFRGCGLKTLTIPNIDENIVISAYAFWGNPLESISLSASVRKIGTGAFGNTNIKELTIPKNVSELGGELPENLEKFILEESDEPISLPRSATPCKEVYFYRPLGPKESWSLNDAEYYSFCFVGVDKVVFGSNVESIPMRFASLTGKNSLVIPGTIKSIGKFAFCLVDDVAVLPSIVIEEGDGYLELRHKAAAKNDKTPYSIQVYSPLGLKTKKVELSRPIRYAGQCKPGLTWSTVTWGPSSFGMGIDEYKDVEFRYYPIFNSEGLVSFIITKNLELTFESNTYYGFSYYQVYLGNGHYDSKKRRNTLTETVDGYFDVDGFEPKTLVMKTDIPPKCNIEFPNSTYMNTTLYVPIGCKEAYQQADVWKNFFDIVEGEPAPEADVPVVGVDQNQPVVLVDNGCINISGLNEMETVRIYDVHGRLVYSGNESNIRLNRTGMFILKGDTFSHKVIL